MENLKNISVNLANGIELAANVKAMPRSLVLVNTKKETAYNVVAKCRNNDPVSLAKSLCKAILAALKAKLVSQSTEAMKKSGRTNYNELQSALSSQVLLLTDKNGAIIPEGCLSVGDRTDKNGKPLTLGKVFRFSRSENIYKLIVGTFDKDGNFIPSTRTWDDPEVVSALKWTVTAMLEQLDWHKMLDDALLTAANSTEKEQKAEAKAAAPKEAKAAA